MKKTLFLFLSFVCWCVCVSCIYDPNYVPTEYEGYTSTTLSRLTLQSLIDGSQEDCVIDLRQYKNLSDYNATINKPITLSNGNLLGATLKIQSDSVILNNINYCDVVTDSSVVVSNCTLNNVTVDSTKNSRGFSQNNGKFPSIELKNNCKVQNSIEINIENTLIVVQDLTVSNLFFRKSNTQLTIKDKKSKIKNIYTNSMCKVILESGRYADLPIPEVTDNGQLKLIDLGVSQDLKLLKLTPYSGLKNVIKQGEKIDFSSTIMLGTYEETGNITVYNPGGLSYDIKETFSRLEKDFTVSVDGQKVYYNGDNLQEYFWSSLSAGVYSASITNEYSLKNSDYFYNFDITVIGNSDVGYIDDDKDDVVAKCESIEAYINSNVKTTYQDGECLDLSGMIVVGKFRYGNQLIDGLVSDYVLSPQNGTRLSFSDSRVIIKAGGLSTELPISVTSSIKVRYISIDNYNTYEITFVSASGDKVPKLTNLVRVGYEFEGWYTNTNYDVTFDFNQTLFGDIEVYAKWSSISYTVQFDANGGEGEMSPIEMNYDEYYWLPQNQFTKDGYKFCGWSLSADDTIATYKNGYEVKNLASRRGQTVTLYAIWKEYGAGSYKDDERVGSVLLNDGTVIPYSSDMKLSDSQKSKAVGILFVANGDKPYVMGLNYSGLLKWSDYDATQNMYFPNIATSYDWDVDQFDGNLDGSKNWGYICAQDPSGTKDSATYYPTFNYALTYGKNNNLSGSFAKDWYVPALSQMYAIYMGRSKIDKALVACGKPSLIANKEQEWCVRFWTSSQDSTRGVYTDAADFYFQEEWYYDYSSNKEWEPAHVCAIRDYDGSFVGSFTQTGNFKLDGVEYNKTGLVQVCDSPVIIEGSGSTGVFISGRTIKLSPYCIGKYEVTQELYQKIMGTNPSSNTSNITGETAKLKPVDSATYYEVMTFCNKLSVKCGLSPVYGVSGITDWANVQIGSVPTNIDSWTTDITKNGYRLPTEAEWEFAARGAKVNGKEWNYSYVGSNSTSEVAWTSENSGYKSHEVGLKQPNSLGIYDMTGNAWEWCIDWYNSIQAKSETELNPYSTVNSSVKTQRGGAWKDPASWAIERRSDGCGGGPTARWEDWGFRLAKTL